MVLQMLVDFVNLEFFPTPEVLSTDVASVHLKVDLAVVVVELVRAREGHVTRLALLLGVVVVDVVLVFAIPAKDFAARLTKFAVAGVRVNSRDVSVTLRLFGEGPEKNKYSDHLNTGTFEYHTLTSQRTRIKD